MAIKFAGGRFEIVPNWKIALFYVLLMPLLLWLGFWQIERADEKRVLEGDYQERQQAAPLPLREALPLDDKAYVRIVLSGQFDNERLVLLDNKVFKGRAGYEVIAPFVLDAQVSQMIDGRKTVVDFVWVNRGWIDLGGSREYLPVVPAVNASQTIIAGIDIPVGEPFVLADEPLKGSWPEVVQKVDVAPMTERYQEEVDLNAAPFMVRISPGSAGELQSIWRPINMSPAKHLGYALQWFSMALVLTVLYLYVTIKRVKEDELNAKE